MGLRLDNLAEKVEMLKGMIAMKEKIELLRNDLPDPPGPRLRVDRVRDEVYQDD
jgi:hypothetical protein